MIEYLKTAKFGGKTVLLRVDMNEPVEKGKLLDDFRVQKIIPTIQFLLNKKCKVIVAAHLGRPEGGADRSLSLKPAAERLAELLGRKFVETKHELPSYPVNHVIFFTGGITSPRTRLQIQEIPNKDVIVLENLRFYPGEEKNSKTFARQLADCAQVYVNDAFAVSHRSCASVDAITEYLPSYAGLELEQEIKSLRFIMEHPQAPFAVMMGGIKITDKAKTLSNLAKKADIILLGGGLANVLFSAKGLEIGKSKVEKEGIKIGWQLEKTFKNKIVLPIDVVVGNLAMDKKSIRSCDIHSVKKNEVIYDLGPKTILLFAKHLKTARSIVWNGPLGLFERRPFDTSTLALAKVIGGSSKRKSFSVVGGGETVDAVRLSGQADYIDHLSTGGGAMLEFLAGEKLPGIKALE